MYLLSIVIIILRSVATTAQSDLNGILGALSHQVMEEYFADCRCLGIITEDSSNFIDSILPLSLPFYHIQLSVTDLINSVPLSK